MVSGKYKRFIIMLFLVSLFCGLNARDIGLIKHLFNQDTKSRYIIQNSSKGRIIGASNGKKVTKIKIHINADGKGLHAYPID